MVVFSNDQLPIFAEMFANERELLRSAMRLLIVPFSAVKFPIFFEILENELELFRSAMRERTVVFALRRSLILE